MKVLLTGVAGTGKSTLAKALRERGFLAVDFSEVPGMCFWQDINTKEKVIYSPVESREWFRTKHFICDIQKLTEIIDKQDDIIMTGVASGNQVEYFPLFDKILLLQCNPETSVHRMQTRNTAYGKTKAEQDDLIEWQKEFNPLLMSQGAIPVSTEGEINTVLDTIVTLIQK